MCLKRITLLVTLALMLSSSPKITLAEVHTDLLEQQLNENEEIVNQKEEEKQSVSEEITKIKTELTELESSVINNKTELEGIETRIKDTNALIDKKKSEILVLQNKTHSRYQVMKQRLKALQVMDTFNFTIETLINSNGINDFIQRITAISILLNADNEIFSSQRKDLVQIEEDKKYIDEKEQILIEIQQELFQKQEELDNQLLKKQESIDTFQSKYDQLSQEIALVEQDKSGIELQIKQIKEQLVREQEEAERIKDHLKIEQEKAARKTAMEILEQNEDYNQELNGKPIQGIEMYVEATAYSWEETNANGYITKLGYNIKTDPSLKLIAVDPSVIPLGSKVWVEGYGVAVAGDTGGAIKGYIVDVLMHSKADALQWGRKKVVKLVVVE